MALRVDEAPGAHLVAGRAAISVLMPLLVLVALDRPEWAAYAAFGAFTSLYGRRDNYGDRAAMQVAAFASLLASVLLGVLVSMLPGHAWWMVFIGTLVAAGAWLLSAALRWHPPGALFQIFGFCVCALVPGQTWRTLPIAAAVCTASGVFAILVGSAGALRPAGSWQRPEAPHGSTRVTLALPDARRQLLRYLIGVPVAGTLGILFGGSHPYWAMVSVGAALAGAGRHHRIARALQRMCGTLIGVLVAGALLAPGPSPWLIVLLVGLMQFVAELLVGRNYGLAMLAVTPLAMLVGELGRHQPVGQLMLDRAVETAIGAVVAIAVVWCIREPRKDGEAAVSAGRR